MPIFNVLRISINKFLDQWPDHPTLKTVSAIISLHFLICYKPSGYFREFSRKTFKYREHSEKTLYFRVLSGKYR